MSIDPDLVIGSVSEYIICLICFGVFDDPIECHPCGHVFCRNCAARWFENHEYCPVDRKRVTHKQCPLGIVLKMLTRTHLKCEYFNNGCKEILRLCDFINHTKTCEFGPEGELICRKGCGCKIKRKNIEMHDCVAHLTELIAAHQDKIYPDKQALRCCGETLDCLKREWSQMCDFMYMKHKIDRKPQDKISRLPIAIHHCFQMWSTSLPLASVTMWGKIFPRPGARLQRCLKKALAKHKCPQMFAEMLLKNSTETNWPFGISDMYVRKKHLSILNTFVLRKIPDMQAVVMDFHQNRHVSLEYRTYPGLVFVFESGVE
ncbi:E3 ubiquitin-protein ligase NRDP1-like [Teleopsis dalmanni]|uniref:E3 ubiquitin-protein ligase NRDP1-like n=1 Tax=Teleopsis dalmanni TaxID=139649 RepID=UPI0018CEA63F|nr:E3 ubiquitin-protein ligase NRDP1-like [Teleopsis dalmanni]